MQYLPLYGCGAWKQLLEVDFQSQLGRAGQDILFPRTNMEIHCHLGLSVCWPKLLEAFLALLFHPGLQKLF